MAILHCRSIERRRTARAVVTIEMVVTGLDDEKHKFQFLTKTVSVSANGGVILLEAPLPVGQKFHMVNEFNRKKAACRIVSVRSGKEGKMLGAFELSVRGDELLEYGVSHGGRETAEEGVCGEDGFGAIGRKADSLQPTVHS